MKIENLSQFESLLKSKELPRVYIIRGDNTYYTKKAFESIKKITLNGEENEFTYRSFDGKDVSIDEITLACEMYPLMGTHKCVCVYNPPFEGMTEADFKSFCSLIEDMPDFATLILFAIANDFEDKKQSKDKSDDEKKNKGKKICDLISKVGADINFTSKNTKDSPVNFALSLAKQKGAKLSNSAARLVCEKACNDFAVIETELEKLCNYKSGQEISEKDVNELFSLYLNTSVFELAKAVLANNLEASLKKLSEMKQQKEEAISVLGVLSSNFIDLYRAQAAKNKNVPLETVKADFQYRANVAFKIENAYRDCSRFKSEFVKMCIEKMAQTDILIKTTNADEYQLLEQLIIDIFVTRERIGS